MKIPWLSSSYLPAQMYFCFTVWAKVSSYFISVNFCLHEWMCIMCMTGTCGDQKSVSTPLQWSHSTLWASMWVPWIKSGSFTKELQYFTKYLIPTKIFTKINWVGFPITKNNKFFNLSWEELHSQFYRLLNSTVHILYIVYLRCFTVYCKFSSAHVLNPFMIIIVRLIDMDPAILKQMMWRVVQIIEPVIIFY